MLIHRGSSAVMSHPAPIELALCEGEIKKGSVEVRNQRSEFCTDQVHDELNAANVLRQLIISLDDHLIHSLDE